MIRARRPFRFLVAGCGAALLLIGLTLGYWWCYKLAPMRHLADPEWRAAHSEAARWAEEQQDYRRMGSSPDLCFRGDRIGFYGDKEWFLWLEERIRNPEKFRHCGCTEYALALMANRHVTSWSQWTAANREQSQEEWIRDGFADYGVTVHLPPKPEDTVQLLRLLGRKSWNFLWAGPKGPNDPEAVPSYIHYNAFRWLRDSGFEPLEFASSNATLATESDIHRGLLRFSQWRAAYPGRDKLGILAFGKSGAMDADYGIRPRISYPSFVIGAYILISLITAGGVVLILRPWKRRYADQPTQAGR